MGKGIGFYTRSIALVRKLERKGMVSAIFPKENFFISPRLDQKLIPSTQEALEAYASICLTMLRLTLAAKVVAVFAATVLVVKML